jgi:hypothetical protein
MRQDATLHFAGPSLSPLLRYGENSGEDLVGDRSRIADEQCTLRLKERFELTTRNRRPAALLANLGEGPGVTWEEFVRRLLTSPLCDSAANWFTSGASVGT